MIAPQGLEIGEKLLWKNAKTRYFVFFPWPQKFISSIHVNLFAGQKDLPTQKTWRLNERHYGGLTGLNKAETAEKHGEAQVQIWRRSFDIPPPPMEAGHPYHENITKVGQNFVECHVYHHV